MSLALENEIRRRIDLVERWSGDDDDQLLARCRELLLAADALESDATRTERLDERIVGCLAEALGSLATAVLLLSQASPDADVGLEDGEPDPNRLLFAISQNLRFASEAAELCRGTLSP